MEATCGSCRVSECNGDLYEAAGAADATACSRIRGSAVGEGLK